MDAKNKAAGASIKHCVTSKCQGSHSAEVSLACRVTLPFSLHSAAEGRPTRQADADAEAPGPAQRDRVTRSQHILVLHSLSSL